MSRTERGRFPFLRFGFHETLVNEWLNPRQTPSTTNESRPVYKVYSRESIRDIRAVSTDIDTVIFESWLRWIRITRQALMQESKLCCQ